jgi:hypothetical protein
MDVTEPTENFDGHEGRECGEHYAVRSHRAWCHDCTEWCYPERPCKGCDAPRMRAFVVEAMKALEAWQKWYQMKRNTIPLKETDSWLKKWEKRYGQE